MNAEQRLRESLRQPLEGDRQAEQRAWQVVAAAAPAADAARRRTRLPRRRAAAGLGAAALIAAFALSPPGAAVSSWIGDELGVRETVRHSPASPTLRALPGGGELLVRSGAAGAWVVHADGSRRRVGPYRDVAWSPNGRFVAAVRNRQLLAVTPTGEPRWALTPPRAPRAPRWAPGGLRIAYLSGASVRVVAGDGSGDLELASRAAAVAPAWRPGSADELAVADRRGRMALVSAVTGRTLWRSGPGRVPTELSWSADGRRLAALTPGAVRVLAADGSPAARLRPHGEARFTALGYAPRGRRLAVVEHGRSGDTVHVAEGARSRRVLATAATLADPLWSPDGSWLLVGSPAADQWLFLRPRRPHRVVAISDIAGQLAPGARSAPTPRPVGWCCGR